MILTKNDDHLLISIAFLLLGKSKSREFRYPRQHQQTSSVSHHLHPAPSSIEKPHLHPQEYLPPWPLQYNYPPASKPFQSEHNDDAFNLSLTDVRANEQTFIPSTNVSSSAEQTELPLTDHPEGRYADEILPRRSNARPAPSQSQREHEKQNMARGKLENVV